MGKYIDITGEKYGRLTAIKDVGSLRGFRLWEFMCDCGNVVHKPTGAVRSGKVTSCGCFRSERISSRKTKDLTGVRFGRLLVVGRSGVTNHGHVTWNCICDCGNTKVVSGNSLNKQSGGTRSCGCLHKEVARKIGDRCRKENPISKTKEYRACLRAKLRERPEIAAHERISRLFAHALKAVGALKSSSTFSMLGYTPQELREHLERQFIGGMSWENREKWQIDHIIPISSAKSVNEVIALNQLSNLRPLWADENNKKRNKILTLL